MKNLIIMILFSLSMNVFAEVPISMKVASEFICSQIKIEPNFEYTEHFSKEFIDRVPKSAIIDIFSMIAKAEGNCTSTNITMIGNNTAKMRAVTGNSSYKFIIYVNENNLMTGLMYQGRSDSKTKISSYDELNTAIKGISGESAFFLKELNSPNSLIDISSDSMLALGSEFKLYILKNLVERITKNEFKWSDQFPLLPEIKSLPSGVMQDFPDGSNYSLKTYVSYMISKSDNTATDSMINILGRDKILESMKEYNSFLADNYPFLTTMDMFRMRTLDEATVDQYLKSESNDRLAFLERLKKNINREQLIEKLSDWEEPRDIKKVEWFASPKDLCKTIENLKLLSEKDHTVLDILSISNPFIWTEDDPNFEYVGYKGGSEPGVMTMTFLLKTRNQKWACLSMGINDSIKSLDENSTAEFFHAIITYAGNLLNK